jgi:3-methyladenine DNA glycosylase Mpg
MDYNAFFSRKSEEVAQDLLGRHIVRKIGDREIVAQILETGAYEGGKENASRKGMKYTPGTIFLMPFRGHYFFNIATDKVDYASCIDLRKILADERVVGGSAAITKFLGMPPTLDGVLFEKEMQIIGSPVARQNISIKQIGSDNCIGYFSIR